MMKMIMMMIQLATNQDRQINITKQIEQLI
jgi:hypothetical protein